MTALPNPIDDDPIARIRAAMDQRGWSQRTLAEKTLLGESTVFRLLRGEYTAKTLRKVEHALGLEAERQPVAPLIADLRYGAYVRQLFSYYEGSYCCIRPGFTDLSKLVVYPIDISWSDKEQALIFADRNPGYQQAGVISVPVGAPFLYLVTLDRGSARQMTIFQAPEAEPVLKGLLTTLANPRGRELYPAAAPVLLIRQAGEAACAARLPPDLNGVVDRGHSALASYAALIDALDCPPTLLRP